MIFCSSFAPRGREGRPAAALCGAGRGRPAAAWVGAGRGRPAAASCKAGRRRGQTAWGGAGQGGVNPRRRRPAREERMLFSIFLATDLG
jgi:hypothetical protein